MFKRMFHLLAFSAVALFVALAIGAPQTVSAGAPTGTIAYIVPDETTGDQIWLVQPDGTRNRKIYQTGVPGAKNMQLITGLAWRPDGGELIFTSNHEDNCFWYAYDVYAILPDGSGYRRVTNSPGCAGLAAYPKGTVTLNTASVYGYQIYMEGMTDPTWVNMPNMTLTNVADLGNTLQPIAILNGKDRWMGGAVDVKAGQTVNGGAAAYTHGTDSLGAFSPAWKRDGSRIGYAFGCAELRGIGDHPAAAEYGTPLFDAAGVNTCLMDWGPTAATANNILYVNEWSNNPGIYVTTENGGAGTAAVTMYDMDHMIDVQYLPDAAGFIYSFVDSSTSSNLYRYNFATDTITQLTTLSGEYARDFAISPDGQSVIFERAKDNLLATYGGASDLWMMNIDGSNLRLYISGGAHPSWTSGAGVVQNPPPPQPSGAFRLFLPFIVKK